VEEERARGAGVGVGKRLEPEPFDRLEEPRPRQLPPRSLTAQERQLVDEWWNIVARRGHAVESVGLAYLSAARWKRRWRSEMSLSSAFSSCDDEEPSECSQAIYIVRPTTILTAPLPANGRRQRNGVGIRERTGYGSCSHSSGTPSPSMSMAFCTQPPMTPSTLRASTPHVMSND
jgi:hypothetical protein